MPTIPMTNSTPGSDDIRMMGPRHRRFIRHWSQYIRAHYVKNKDYWTNKDGDITSLAEQCMIEVTAVIGTRAANQALQLMIKERERENAFKEEQKMAMYQLD
jgi:hypothetical protein